MATDSHFNIKKYDFSTRVKMLHKLHLIVLLSYNFSHREVKSHRPKACFVRDTNFLCARHLEGLEWKVILLRPVGHKKPQSRFSLICFFPRNLILPLEHKFSHQHQCEWVNFPRTTWGNRHIKHCITHTFNMCPWPGHLFINQLYCSHVLNLWRHSTITLKAKSNLNMKYLNF